MLAGLLSGVAVRQAAAAPPDLTAGAVVDTSLTYNLGATGARGWIYTDGFNLTNESRQILVTQIEDGSPAAAGSLAVNDVILGASGTTAAPAAFTADARKSLGLAIGDAEKDANGGILKLRRWRAGVTSTVSLTLRVMGSYSATAPYNCPKSQKILTEGAQYIAAHQDLGLYSFGALALLAAGDPAYQTAVQSAARALVPSTARMQAMMSDAATGDSWELGHTCVFLSEYYLATGDATVLPAIQAYAVNIAKGGSLFGTYGHGLADKTESGGLHGSIPTYGPVNSAGLPCFLGMLLAKKCGVVHPELDPAIARSSTFYAYYAGKGSPPYGEHEPWVHHENNGKSGLCALAFSLQNTRTSEMRFFSQMSTASAQSREWGHTGTYFSALWTALGANCGGETAAAAYFHEIIWLLDLARRWDGSFAGDLVEGGGGGSGGTYHGFSNTAAFLLTYALPKRQLQITGKGQDSAKWLSTAEVTAAIAAGNYVAGSRTTDQLMTDLGNWSPWVRDEAARQLAARTTETAARVPTLLAMAQNTSGGTSRAGACRALGLIKDTRALPVLTALLTDPDRYVRFMAAKALDVMGEAARPALNDILTAAAALEEPVEPLVEADPLHMAQGQLAFSLFYADDGLLARSLTGVNRSLLYPAVSAMSRNPDGLARSSLTSTYALLTYADVQALAGPIIETAWMHSQADTMFAWDVQLAACQVLEKYRIAEGVPLCVRLIPGTLSVIEDYAGGVKTVAPDPDVLGTLWEKRLEWLSYPWTEIYATQAEAAIAAIESDPNPATLVSFKSIASVTATPATLTLPANTSTLNAAANDFAGGNLIYTWRKVHGAGVVSFTPNGTTASASTSATFALAGLYLLEVTVSDAHGLTEVRGTVPVTVYRADGTLPSNNPPVAYAQSVTVLQDRAVAVTLSGADPDGYELVYAVTDGPGHGTLSGTAPALVYTPDPRFAGSDQFTFTVMDSEGVIATAAVNLTVSAVASRVVLYEGFDYATGADLHGQGPTSDFGFNGYWIATTGSGKPIIGPNLPYGTLPTDGGGLRFESLAEASASRSISTTTLAGRGLLDDGAVLWFSMVMGCAPYANPYNQWFYVALASDRFASSGTLASGEGIGIHLAQGTVRAAAFNATGSPVTDPKAGPAYEAGEYGLVVGKITWGSNGGDDTIELYQPGTDLVLNTPISTLHADLDQAAFDTLTLSRIEYPILDEIRFGTTYDAVIGSRSNTLGPVAEAGGDRTLIYKFLGTVLDGTASYDSGGSISSYSWSQVSGPNTATLTSANTATATATGLVTGTYVFRLTVTDNQGAQASDDVTVVALDNPIINGGFETGDLTGWTAAGDPVPVLESTNTHSGNYAAFIGNDSGQGGTGWYNLYLGTPNLLANLPANATLSFWVYRRSAGGIVNVRVREGTGAGSTDLVNPWPVPRASYNDTGWVNYTVDLSALAGKTITLYVELYQSDKHTYMLLDDVELLVLPKADFSATPTQGVVPLTVGFTDTSFAGDGPITNRHWNFGDGTTLDTTATSVTHTYTTPGSRTVTLTITNSSGRSDTLTRTSLVQAVGTTPVASFTATPASGLAPLSVTFSDSSTPGPGTITNRHWNFGDGTTLDTTTTTSVPHTYGSPGNYVVTLTVTDSTGPTGSTSSTVVANPVNFTNGNFETGDFTGWTATTGVAITTANTHSGTSAAMVGRTAATTSGTIYNLTSNAVTLPANATLSFWVYRKNNGGDVLNLRVRGGSPVADVDPWPIPRASYNDTGWVHYTVDLSAHVGKSVYIYIEVFVSANRWNYMLIDDVSLLQPATYDSWAFARGLPAMNAGGDFDGDGISNLVEYALGLTPTVPNKPPGSLTGSVLSFGKGAEAVANGDVSYAIEESDDLGATDPWTAVASYTTNNSTTISYTLPASRTKTFARLRVVKLTP